MKKPSDSPPGNFELDTEADDRPTGRRIYLKTHARKRRVVRRKKGNQ